MRERVLDAIKRATRAGVWFALSVAIPFALCWWLFSRAAKVWGLWRWHPIIWALLFVILVVGGSTVLGLGVDRLRGWYRGFSVAGRADRIERRSRLLKPVIVHFFLPFTIAIAVAVLPLGGDTILTKFIKWLQAQGEYAFIPRIGNAVLTAQEIETKVEGVRTLDAIHCGPCLDELFRILEGNQELLEEWEFHVAIEAALASYGGEAVPRLVEILREYEGRKSHVGTMAGELNLHTRFFEPSFTRLRQEAEESIVDPDKKRSVLLQLEQSELRLKTALRSTERSAPEIVGRDTILDIVLAILLDMEELDKEPEIYTMARRIVTDTSYSYGTRRKALLLIAKLGGKADFAVVVPYLDAKEEELRRAAFAAIANLHNKVSGEDK